MGEPRGLFLAERLQWVWRQGPRWGGQLQALWKVKFRWAAQVSRRPQSCKYVAFLCLEHEPVLHVYVPFPLMWSFQLLPKCSDRTQRANQSICGDLGTASRERQRAWELSRGNCRVSQRGNKKCICKGQGEKENIDMSGKHRFSIVGSWKKNRERRNWGQKWYQVLEDIGWHDTKEFKVESEGSGGHWGKEGI